MRMTDVIERFLKELIEDADGIAEIQRNELAGFFNCVPSQINYVITTRFTAERGYIVESRRGGGGYIKIEKVNVNKSNYLMHIVNSIGESISQQTSEAFINNFLDYERISLREAKLMKMATSDKVLNLHHSIKDKVRARILKNMVLSLI